jgi:hypothetical protein
MYESAKSSTGLLGLFPHRPAFIKNNNIPQLINKVKAWLFKFADQKVF